MARARYKYYSDCVTWQRSKIWELENLIDNAVEIQRQTIMLQVGSPLIKQLEKQLGYAKHHTQGLTMAKDWAVSYFKTEYRGKPAYFVRHSAIEYIFIQR